MKSRQRDEKRNLEKVALLLLVGDERISVILKALRVREITRGRRYYRWDGVPGVRVRASVVGLRIMKILRLKISLGNARLAGHGGYYRLLRVRGIREVARRRRYGIVEVVIIWRGVRLVLLLLLVSLLR